LGVDAEILAGAIPSFGGSYCIYSAAMHTLLA